MTGHTTQIHPFSAWIPFDVPESDIAKAGDAEAKMGLTKGIASSELKDADGEIVEQDGLDFSDCRLVTLEHPLGVVNIIGETLDFEQVTVKGFKATQASANIYLTDPLGRATFQKAVSMNKAGAKNKLGWSIEGNATEREPGRIKKAKITSLAVSAMPKNRMALFDPIAASLISGIGGGVPGLPLMWPMFKAEAGYPTQGVPSSNAFAAKIAQSIQCVHGSDTDALDDATAKLLKRMPHITWMQGRAAITSIRERLLTGAKAA